MSAPDHQDGERSAEAAGASDDGGSARSTAEVHDIYGDAESILRAIDGMGMKLGDRRWYVLVVAGARSAEVHSYEQVGTDSWAVSAWRGNELGDLQARLTTTVLSTPDIDCVGGQIEALVADADAVTLELRGVVPAPSSARAAFAHTLRAHGDRSVIRVTLALLR